jgi:hypothetical protein
MRRSLILLVAVIAIVSSARSMAFAQAPTGAEAQAVWDAFWGRIAAGDISGARRYVHTTRQGLPWTMTGSQLLETARQMQHCRLGSDPLPDSGEDVLFEVRCQHAGQIANTFVGFRQDLDGSWRLTVL